MKDATEKKPEEKVVLHQWPKIRDDEWKRAGINFQEVERSCTRCGLQVKLRRTMGLDGFGSMYVAAYRKKGESWQKKYSAHDLQKKAMPKCITLEEHLKRNREKYPPHE